jgi:hypothetical protein
MRSNGRTEMTRLIVAFRRFAKALIKTNQLMLFRDIITVCCKNQVNHITQINYVIKISEFLMSKQSVPVVSIPLYKFELHYSACPEMPIQSIIHQLVPVLYESSCRYRLQRTRFGHEWRINKYGVCVQFATYVRVPFLKLLRNPKFT